MNWKPIQQVKYIVIHCAATTEDQDIGAEEIRSWHLQRGWLDIGYHKVIRRDGTIENGRELNVPGAHARGFNHISWGICLVGGVESDNKTPESNFTHAQWDALLNLVRDMKAEVPSAQVVGHRDLPNVNKACPSFDVKEWWEQMNTEPTAEIIPLFPGDCG
jgi:N-acetyl-anhydromuramyl-L-alanine amidase AmpD